MLLAQRDLLKHLARPCCFILERFATWVIQSPTGTVREGGQRGKRPLDLLLKTLLVTQAHLAVRPRNGPPTSTALRDETNHLAAPQRVPIYSTNFPSGNISEFMFTSLPSICSAPASQTHLLPPSVANFICMPCDMCLPRTSHGYLPAKAFDKDTAPWSRTRS